MIGTIYVFGTYFMLWPNLSTFGILKGDVLYVSKILPHFIQNLKTEFFEEIFKISKTFLVLGMLDVST